MRVPSIIVPLALLLLAVLGGAGLAWLRGRSAATPERPFAVVTTHEPYAKLLEAPDGTTVALSAPPRRLIALSLAAEEVIVELAGVGVLAAVSEFTRRPELSNIADAVAAVPTDVVGTNPEQVVRLRPDLVLVTSYTEPRARSALERCGVAVFPLPEPRDLASIRENVDLLGRILDREQEASALLAAIDVRLQAVRESAPPGPRPRVLYISGPEELWVAGAGTVIGEVIELAGGVNAAAEHGLAEFHRVNRELLLNWDPEWVLTEARGPRSDPLEGFREDPLLSRLEAVREERAVALPARVLTSVSHHVVEAVEMLARELRRGTVPR